ncbi:SbcC/MukB-like Walker B domain-containing protein [Bacillus carboniphilus]|uniref:SbcC/MukB-like Walker B domain-containing protein n=1 Tax=Bacillus carboniphilus TaxID=86663 RepID=UPI003531FF54
MSPYYVSSALEKELADQKGWLDEQDRQLYEDIIVNHVGVILRNRIQRAQKWVKQMDQIMAERDNSSGLIFSISWKPHTADSEQELDTKDLVQLLQRNSKFLSEEDLDRITKHFQSKIETAKELIQLRNEGSTLHQVLKEVLDYRKWFSFELSFRRVNEPKRELSNNRFFQFSGGEKAMAMYIPLFTAAYSRYKEANEMAPHIISLDEAFAGVDENNIRDMFEVVEQLGFNYIMNSQALWGDYDTISSLSISELVRPKNADYVTVIRYEWDGKQKSLVFEEDQEQKEFAINEG